MLIALLQVMHMIICNMRLYAVIFAMGLLAAGCKATASVPPDGGSVTETADQSASGQPSPDQPVQGQPSPDQPAQSQPSPDQPAQGQPSDPETGNQTKTEGDGLVPVYGTELKDGVYPVKVDSSSGMFQITACKLTVKDGAMSAVMTMGGKGYLKLFMGTGQEALKAADQDFIPYVETKEGTHTFTVPVKALDMEIDCSAFSKKKEKWYDRVLVFRSDSLPLDAFAEGKIVTAKSLGLEDGMYTAQVRLEGGSGRATVESPASLRVQGGKIFATIAWDSPNFDYMKVNDEKFEAVNTGGNSTFEIPVMGFDWKIPVAADTIAMSQPHEISYTLVFDSATLKKAE